MSDTPILNTLRTALTNQINECDSHVQDPQVCALVDELIADKYPLDLIEACDLLERACAAGNLYVVQRLCEYSDFFVYRSFALVLALRSGHVDVARWLIEHEKVDLLAPIQRPERMSVMLPPDTTFTRSALTKASTYLFLNPLDPTPSSYILRPYTGFEQLAEPRYVGDFSMEKAAQSIHEIVALGLVDNTVFDDLFRAYLVAAARKYRDRRSQEDLYDAQICLDEAAFMYNLYTSSESQNGYGDIRIENILESILVPKTAYEILYFVALNAPDIFLRTLSKQQWLQNDINTLVELTYVLKPSHDKSDNGCLLIALAKHNKLDELKFLESWHDNFDVHAYETALELASDLEFIEESTYLASYIQKTFYAQDAGENSSSDLSDLML